MVSSIEQIANGRNTFATELRDQGRVEEARRVLIENFVFCNDNAERYGAPGLSDLGRLNFLQANDLEESDWNYTRKLMRAQQCSNRANQLSNQRELPAQQAYLQRAQEDGQDKFQLGATSKKIEQLVQEIQKIQQESKEVIPPDYLPVQQERQQRALTEDSERMQQGTAPQTSSYHGPAPRVEAQKERGQAQQTLPQQQEASRQEQKK
jgi:hypothetical protein